MMIIKRTTQFLLILLLFFACSEDKSTNTEATAPAKPAGLSIISSSDSGITFNNALSDDPLSDKNVLSYQLYFNGAGVGIADFNNDGLEDIFFAGNEVPNELYINKGDFKFEKLDENSGINKNKTWASGVSIVDINLDGFKDIYVCQQGPYPEAQRKNLFYINNGDLTFTEAAQSMGLDDANSSTQAAFLDYDKDGDLDCYVMNESKYAGVLLSAVFKDLEKKDNLLKASGKLFENTGNLKFKDVTEKAGVLNYGYGLGLAISDINGDNYPDIYVVNDYTVPDFLYINQKDGTFKESIKEFTRQITYFGMGCDVADINNDGLVDIGVVDMAAEDHIRDKTLMASMDVEKFKYYFYDLEYHFQYMFNSLQLNNGNNTFSNVAALAGILRSDWSWAAFFTDFNLDGHKDFYVSNGYRRYARDNDFRIRMDEIRNENNGTIPKSMRADVYKMMPEIKLDNKLYMSDGQLHFDDHSTTFTQESFPSYSYGAAYADFDNDGDMDLVVNNIDQKALLFKNSAKENTGNNYLKIKLDVLNPAKKIGAKVKINTASGIQFQEYNFVRGYESCMQEVLLFGLGKDSNVNEIEIVWADGNVQKVSDVKVNQTLEIKYTKGGQFNPSSQNLPSLLEVVDSEQIGVSFRHKENPFDDFEKEILLPQRQTAFGPALVAADINKDGLEDFYVGGAKGQSGEIYTQNQSGKFSKRDELAIASDFGSEDVDAIFVDPNQDGLMDLIVLSGGSGDFVGQEALLQNRFYANTGEKLLKIGNVLPVSTTASYKIIAENIDSDPVKELIVFGAAQPGRYPQKEKTVLLDYDGKKYVDRTDELIPELNNIDGILRDGNWTDLNNDGKLDFITVGEWSSVNVFLNEDGKFKNKTSTYISEEKYGWWKSIKAADLDNDGDMDFILGNVGKNFKQKATTEKPLYLFSNDFDNNGTLDCVLAKYYDDKIVPARGKECSTEQMPFISEKFETYSAFANASLGDILGEEKIKEGIKLQATDFGSYYLWNENGKLVFEQMPPMAQISPINDIQIIDINKDGMDDIMIVGNDYNTEYETPRLDAGNGLVLLNKGSKKLDPLSINKSGLFAPKDAKHLITMPYQNGSLFIVANNNDQLSFFKKRG